MATCGVNKIDQLGQLLPTQDSVEYTQFLEVPCFTSLPRDDLVPLEFRIEKSDMAVDISNIHISLTLKVVKSDGSAIPAPDFVAPINQLAYSMFRSVDLYLSNQRVTINQANYPFLAYVNNLLFTSKDQKSTILNRAGWYDDDAGDLDTITQTFEEKDEKTGKTKKRRDSNE